MGKLKNRIRRFFKRLSVKRGEEYIKLRGEKFLRWRDCLDNYPSKKLGEIYYNNQYIRDYWDKSLSGYRGYDITKYLIGEWDLRQMFAILKELNKVYVNHLELFEHLVKTVKNKVYRDFPEQRKRYGYIDFNHVRLVEIENCLGEKYFTYIVSNKINDIIGGFGVRYTYFGSSDVFIKVDELQPFNETWVIRPMSETSYRYLRDSLHILNKRNELDVIETAWEKQNTYYKLKMS